MEGKLRAIPGTPAPGRVDPYASMMRGADGPEPKRASNMRVGCQLTELAADGEVIAVPVLVAIVVGDQREPRNIGFGAEIERLESEPKLSAGGRMRTRDGRPSASRCTLSPGGLTVGFPGGGD